MLLHIGHDGLGKLMGTLDSLDQGASIPCTNFILSGNRLSFEVPRVQGTFTGKLRSDGNTLAGTWTQGTSTHIVFTRQTSAREPEKSLATAHTFQFGGETRTYYFLIPDGNGPLPVVVLLHGSESNGQVMVDAWKTLASKEHFIVVAPNSHDGFSWSTETDSPAFLHAVVQQIAVRHAIDADRVYLFGHSVGAVYALVLALIDSNYYAATALHAGALPPGDENALFARDVRRMPIAIWVGDNDPFFPIASVSKTKQILEEHGFHVKLAVVPNHNHNYYVISDDIDGQAWDFFKNAGPKNPKIDGKR